MTAAPPQPPEHLSLASLFPGATRDEWLELVKAALVKSGRMDEHDPADRAEAVLTSTTYDGIKIKPLYIEDDVSSAERSGVPGQAPFVRGSRAGGPVPTGWDVRQRHAHPDPEVTREAVMADLENGVTSLWLVLGPGGLPLGSLDDVLRDVFVDLAPVVLDAGADTEAAAAEFLAVIESRGVDAASVTGNLGADPIGLRARLGAPPAVTLDPGAVTEDRGVTEGRGAVTEEPGAVTAEYGAATEDRGAVTEDRGAVTEDRGAVTGDRGAVTEGRGAAAAEPGAAPDLGVLARLVAAARGTGLRVATVDATVYHDAGGSDADELGASLATGVAYLRALTSSGLSIDDAFGQLDFRYAASADQFLTIAKFRAARRLWARVAEVCGADVRADRYQGQRQHAVTSSAMMTRRDPWVNLLRTTLACFGAGVGGAGAVTVQPFDAALGLPDGFARRIARNTSSLLVMESHLARVIDPAGGSWYVERLTDDLAHAAWAWFTEIERAGGIVAALDSGLVAGRLNETWDQRAVAIATRTDALTGVSEFPDVNERPVTREPFPPGPAPAHGGLRRRRYAEEYEALRDAADAAPDRPAVFLATIGSAAASTGRATFAANLFQAGGFATPTSGVGDDPAAIAARFRESGARVACLASTDKVYAEHAVPVAAALEEAGAEQIWLAGRPGDVEHVSGYVHVGVDALAVLRAVHHQVL